MVSDLPVEGEHARSLAGLYENWGIELVPGSMVGGRHSSPLLTAGACRLCRASSTDPRTYPGALRWVRR